MIKIAMAVLVAVHLAVAGDTRIGLCCGRENPTRRRVAPMDAPCPGGPVDDFMVSPDNIGYLPHGSADAQSSFIASAAALALLELASALCGAYYLASLLRASATSNGTRKA